jgi:hypothetical protein
MKTQHSFFASIINLNEQEHTATFYLMNTSPNRNRWGVTDQALQDALPTLKGVKIGMGANYKIDKHYPKGETIDSGEFISAELKSTYALGTARIDDAQTWGLMKQGKLKTVSVCITCYSDVCSKCNANFRGMEDPMREHGCFTDSSTYSKVESFVFARVDFVDVPAYPQAGVLEMSAQALYDIPPTLFEAVKDMRAQLRLPAHSIDESEETIMTGACKPAKFEYTTKEAAALEDAIAKTRIKCGFAPGYEE